MNCFVGTSLEIRTNTQEGQHQEWVRRCNVDSYLLQVKRAFPVSSPARHITLAIALTVRLSRLVGAHDITRSHDIMPYDLAVRGTASIERVTKVTKAGR